MVTYAREKKVDMLVLGSRGMGAVKRCGGRQHRRPCMSCAPHACNRQQPEPGRARGARCRQAQCAACRLSAIHPPAVHAHCLCPTGSTLMSMVGLGSVSDYCLHNLHAPVAVVRGREEDAAAKPRRKVMVALDESELSKVGRGRQRLVAPDSCEHCRAGRGRAKWRG